MSKCHGRPLYSFLVASSIVGGIFLYYYFHERNKIRKPENYNR
jgi:hypothetical protein